MRRDMRETAAAVALLTVASIWTGAPAAAGAESSRAFCFVLQSVTLPKGLSVAEGRADYTSEGHIDCTGEVRGKTVTGPGWWQESGFIEGSCLTGIPNFKVAFSVPTEDGEERVRLNGKATYFGPLGLRSASEYPGGFAFYPTRGDCVTEPVTEAEVVVYGVLLT